MTNKHLVPAGPYPMVYHPLKKLAGAGIGEVLLVSGLLGSAREFACQLTYRVQYEAGDIAQAPGLAKHFARDSRSKAVIFAKD